MCIRDSFYTAIIINPQMMADDMKRNGGFIPGVKPGKQTVNYIDTIMTPSHYFCHCGADSR